MEVPIQMDQEHCACSQTMAGMEGNIAAAAGEKARKTHGTPRAESNCQNDGNCSRSGDA